MQIPQEIIEKVKEQTDIVDIISESVRLKRTGKNFIGLCPFHSDKTPSFSVSQEKQIYKCFACGEAGNVLTFVMKQKNLTFVEAVKYLANKANIPINLQFNETPQYIKKREILYKINVETGRYYFTNLQKTHFAKDYFLNRGIKEETIKRFGLGYSKNSWRDLINYLKSKGYKDDFLVEAGLVSKSQEKGNIYDRFRNRVMFPVFDVKGRVIGFGGRVLDDSKPKYLNSPETSIFQKGINLYGLNFAVKNKLKEDYIIIVEGYMDLITLHQYGVTNVVASLGTALTNNQAKLLKRYTNNVIISYDADIAGQTATLRGLEILRNSGFEVKVLIIPQGKDPDEFVRSNGKDAFLKLAKDALPLIEYRIKKVKDGINLKDRNNLIRYGEKVAEILADLNPVEKDVYIKKISEDTGIKEQALFDLLSQVMSKKLKEDNYMNKKEYFGTKLYVEPAYLKAERALLKLMLNEETYDQIKDSMSSEDFILDSHKRIYSLILESKNKNSNNIELYVENRCDEVETSKEWIAIKELEILDLSNKDKLIRDYLNEVKCFKLQLEINDLKNEQKRLEDKGMIEESIKLAVKLTNLEILKKRKRG